MFRFPVVPNPYLESKLLQQANERDWAHMPNIILYRLLRNIAWGGVDPRYKNGRIYKDGRL